MHHVILFGDSIFDNAGYVPNEPCVTEQLRHHLPAHWKTTLLAVDGDITEDIATQSQNLPDDATHFVLSCGGNDALRQNGILKVAVDSVSEGFEAAALLREDFRRNYRNALTHLLSFDKPLATCTIYDAVPTLSEAESSALALYNEIILKESFLHGLPVIDLRIICDNAEDYASMSPIEPSSRGGQKITKVMATLLQNHDFTVKRTIIYT